MNPRARNKHHHHRSRWRKRLDWRKIYTPAARRWEARATEQRLRDTLLLAGMVRMACCKDNGIRTIGATAMVPAEIPKEKGDKVSANDTEINKTEMTRLTRVGRVRRRVQWPDDIGRALITVHVIGQSPQEAWRERTAENLRETNDLVCRYFDLPLDCGGCAGRWSVLIRKVSALKEPDYTTVGRFWALRFGSDTPRPEEHSIMPNATFAAANPVAEIAIK